jgi:hypothetical protein
MVGSVAARPSATGGSLAGGGETPRGADSPGEAAVLFTQALTAKDQLVDQLEREVAAARRQAAAYETRFESPTLETPTHNLFFSFSLPASLGLSVFLSLPLFFSFHPRCQGPDHRQA